MAYESFQFPMYLTSGSSWYNADNELIKRKVNSPVKNDKGQVVSGTVISKFGLLTETAAADNYSIITRRVETVSANNNAPFAVFMFKGKPAFYEYGYGSGEAWNTAFHGNPEYYATIVSTVADTISTPYSKIFKGEEFTSLRTVNKGDGSVKDSINSKDITSYGNIYSAREIAASNILNVTGYGVNPSFVPFDNDYIERFAEWAENIDINLYFSPVLSRLSGTWHDLGQYGDQIFSTFPIFTLDSADAMINYFKNGTIDGAENKNDLAISDINLATDWTVYVKGTRYPDIYVSAYSDGLENFLKNPELNTTGLSKNDFTIEWKIPDYEGKDNVVQLSGNFHIQQDVSYNNAIQLNFQSLFFVNYRYVDWIKVFGDNNDDIPEEVFPCSAWFRLNYRDIIYSSWVSFHGYYIGSPSVKDFKPWRGGIESLPDGSTIRIVYDENPPFLNGYTDPTEESTVENTEPESNTTLSKTKLTTSYKITNENLTRLAEFLWSDSFIHNLALLNNSPIENIVGLKIIPIDLKGAPNKVVIGNVNTDVTGEVINEVPNIIIGEIEYNGYYGNFLDYSPYTDVSIFLPFIGFLPIDPAQITGHKLKVIYSFDIVMGQCKALLFVDDIYFLSADGAAGINVPLIASDRAQFDAGLLSSVAGAVVSVGSAAASGGATAPLAAGAVANVGTTFMQNQIHYTRNGQYSPTLGWCETRNCYLIIGIPEVDVPTTYAHDYGLPCNLSYGLATLSGYTVCASEIDLKGLSCTEPEKEMVKQLLTTGVYL